MPYHFEHRTEESLFEELELEKNRSALHASPYSDFFSWRLACIRAELRRRSTTQSFSDVTPEIVWDRGRPRSTLGHPPSRR